MAPKFFLLFVLCFLLSFVVILPKFVESKTDHHNNPFQFLQSLEECQKGQKVKGLQDLKKYLHKFGYLNYDNVHVPTTGLDENVVHDHDQFDDLLESAIKTYQQSYRLNVTGILDSNTINQMMKPRCGVPDHVVNGHKSLHNVAHYQFIPGTPRWSKSHLTYTFSSSVRVPATLQMKSVFQSAFERWAKVTQFSFEEVDPAASNADIVIGFHRLNHGDGEPFDGIKGVLAHSLPPSVGKCHFDADEIWSSNPAGVNELDLESVAVHEIGHLLGLGHEPTKPEAIMYPTFSYGRIKRDLNSDDIQGIRTLYGLS
ncbi:hypothetical protein LWI29_020214 [Acer saccharum]|uniref:Peptidase metallopeptidase domain-containing protein n=1 Tax=Acer saccharum TaxID=4024 RepID=A0AA39SK61_ACESA|nr:hypothetical protein LWI29_020214 [Acer saccharum]